MSIEKKSDGVFKIRWWEGGRQKSALVHRSYELARKSSEKSSAHAMKIAPSMSGESSIAGCPRSSTGIGRSTAARRNRTRDRRASSRVSRRTLPHGCEEVDGTEITRWYENLTVKRGYLRGQPCGTSMSCIT